MIFIIQNKKPSAKIPFSPDQVIFVDTLLKNAQNRLRVRNAVAVAYCITHPESILGGSEERVDKNHLSDENGIFALVFLFSMINIILPDP